MRIYIVEDDLSVINILEDIIETQGLGEICGDCGGGTGRLRRGGAHPGRNVRRNRNGGCKRRSCGGNRRGAAGRHFA